MANVLKIMHSSTTLSEDGLTSFVALTFQVVDGDSGLPLPYIFVQSSGEGSLTAQKVGVYEYGGMVFNFKAADGSDAVVVAAIPRDEYPDVANMITFTKTKTNWKAAKAGDTVSIDSGEPS